MDNTIKTKRLIIIVAVVIIAIFTIISIITVLQSKNHLVIIDNLDQNISNLPSEEKNRIQTNLYHYVTEQNSVNNKGNKSYYHGNIRDNSVQDKIISYEEYDNIHVTSFILDIESLQYSYKVGFSWSTEKDVIFDFGPISIYCLSPEDSIYDDFSCSKNPYISEDKDDIYSTKKVLSTNCWATIEEPEKSTDKIKIIVHYHPTTNDYDNNTVESSMDSCTNDMKEYLKNQNINLSNYEIESETQYLYY